MPCMILHTLHSPFIPPILFLVLLIFILKLCVSTKDKSNYFHSAPAFFFIIFDKCTLIFLDLWNATSSIRSVDDNKD